MGFFRWPRRKRNRSPAKPTESLLKYLNPFEASKPSIASHHVLDSAHLPIPGAFPATPPESPTLEPRDAIGQDEYGLPTGWESMDIDSCAAPALVTELGEHLHPRRLLHLTPTPSPKRAPSPRPTRVAKPAQDDLMDIDDPWTQQAKQDARLPHGPVSAVQLFYPAKKPIPANRMASWYEAEFQKREKERLARERDLRRPSRIVLRDEPVRLLSKDWIMKIQRALQAGQGNAVARSLAGDDLYQRDIVTCIRPMAWLNDEIINAYLSLVVHYLRQLNGNLNDRPTFHAFNTFFYSTLRDKGYQGVRRWANRAKIGGEALLNVDTVFIPVHESSHWTLLVVRPTERTIEYFDSLGSRGARQVRNVKEWLRGELGGKYKDEEWTVLPSTSSQQDNGSDCGVFLLTNAKAIAVGVDPTSIGPVHITLLRQKIVAELMNGGLHGDFSPLDRTTGAILL
ncbi:Peptidase C48 SUMO/Sentrin/Ubl1 [Penicillium sp. DV-2018c]|nr:Peptidase C48 SUMO/Sentrin/Ubl1 [Penicillium sp. DV-2018c]KAJ5561096.1 Peptidase C48 SUMO/Sentrin/Ubl1 [Penicillium sp. DV-2018c]